MLSSLSETAVGTIVRCTASELRTSEFGLFKRQASCDPDVPLVERDVVAQCRYRMYCDEGVIEQSVEDYCIDIMQESVRRQQKQRQQYTLPWNYGDEPLFT